VPGQSVPTTTAICNLALYHLAASKPIANITEASANAQACLVFYDATRDEVLREFNWPFARRYAALTLVGGTSTVPVTLDFQYSYRVPADCLRVRRILSGNRNESPETQIPFRLGSDTAGGLLYTDFAVIAATSSAPQQPQIEYTAELSAEARFAPDFVQAFAFKLAFYMAPSISQGGDSGKLGARAYQMYQQTMAQAEANALNEQVPDPVVESSFIRAR
jgi:hypothetical protein